MLSTTVQIIDDGAAGYSSAGSWLYSSGQGYGGDVRYSALGNGSDVAGWTFNVAPGRYRVSASWFAHSNRASDAPYTILDGSNALGTVRVNQKQAANDLSDAGTNWEHLGGPYDITGNTLVVTLSDAANGYVIADAVRIEPYVVPLTQIIDDGGAGYTSVGSWLYSSGQGHGGDVRYSALGSGNDVARWTFNVTPGQYRVSASWFAHSNRASDAPYTILDGSNVLGTVQVNQKQTPNDFTDAGTGWEDLGGPYDITGNTLVVALSDAANGYVIADAVRIEPVVASPTQIIDNGAAGYSSVGSWLYSSGQGHGGDVHYSALGSGNDVARWTFSVTPGRYRVSASWFAHANRASDAPYTIFNGSNLLGTVRINQKVAPNDFTDAGSSWEDLGGPYDITGDTLAVELSDAANGYVIADAVRIDAQGTPPPTIGGIIPSSRRVAWQGNVGVTGDIPTNRSPCTTAECNTLYGGTVTTASINAALNSAPPNTVVRIPAGTFDISGSIRPVANVTLRGAGMGVTILRGTAGFSGDGLISYPNGIGDWYLTGSTSYNLVSPQKGDSTVTTAVNHNWSVGDYIQIDQLEDTSGDPKIQLAGSSGSQTAQSCRNPAAPCRPIGQTVKIVSIPAANQAVIDHPLYWTYNQAPQGVEITSFRLRVGLEDFTVDNTISQNQKIVHFSGVFESWMLRVEMTYVTTYGLFMFGGYRNTIRSCTLHDGFAGTGGGYTIMLWNRATANLFEDNIVYNLGIMALMDGSVSGNVFAYNYGTAPTYGNNSAGTTFGTHGAHPIMNLFEANQFEGRFRMDYTWGTSSHGTLFRNRVTNNTNPAYDAVRNLVDLWAWNSYYNVVGNVLGTTGVETIYQETSGPVNQSALVVYAFGETGLFGDRGADGGAAHDTVFRQGNWDSVNNAIRWDEDIVNPDHGLPNSYYLTSKPSFFGDCAWPPIGPDLAPMVTDIPAKRRYDGNPCGAVPP
jgi:hypothetical protein